MKKLFAITLISISLSGCLAQNTIVTKPEKNITTESALPPEKKILIEPILQPEKTPLPQKSQNSEDKLKMNDITPSVEPKKVSLPEIYSFPKQIFIRKGESRKVISFIKILDKFSTEGVTYSSSDSSVLTVSEEGLINAISEGKAQITINYKNQTINSTIEVTILNDKEESKLNFVAVDKKNITDYGIKRPFLTTSFDEDNDIILTSEICLQDNCNISSESFYKNGNKKKELGRFSKVTENYLDKAKQLDSIQRKYQDSYDESNPYYSTSHAYNKNGDFAVVRGDRVGLLETKDNILTSNFTHSLYCDTSNLLTGNKIASFKINDQDVKITRRNDLNSNTGDVNVWSDPLPAKVIVTDKGKV